MDPTDLSWSGTEFTYVVSGLDLPAREHVVAALAVVAQQHPDLVARVDLPSGRLHRSALPPAERAEQLLGADLDPRLDGEATLNLLEAERGLAGDRLRLHVGPGRLAVRLDHGAGDAWTCLHLLAHLQRVALAGGVPAPLPYDVLPSWRRDALLVAGALPHAGTALRALRRRTALGGGEYEPLDARPGADHVQTVAVVSDPGLLARLREARASSGRRVSVAAVVATGLRAHLGDLVAEPEPGLEVVFGTRTGASARAAGNWIAGVWVEAGDDTDPVSVTAAIDEVRRSGLPQLAALSQRQRASRARAGMARQLAPTGRPRLALSHLGAGGPQEQLVGAGGRSPEVLSGARPNGVGTVLASTREHGGALELGLSYHPVALDRSVVQELARRFLADPWGR